MLFRRSQTLTYASAFTPGLPIPPYKHAQTQSPLIHLLPAEIRNKIYTYVFILENLTFEQTQSTGPSQHPLSLLLTCRRVYHEAATLAFGVYTFPMHSDPQWTYLRFRAAVSSLPTHQAEAIRSLSVLSGGSSSTGLALVNALLVFPRLYRFTIRVERENKRQAWHSIHQPMHPADIPLEDVYTQAANKYAPFWFSQVVQTVTSGRAYAWQDGSKWTAQWPQMESVLLYSVVDYGKCGTVQEELRMDTDAVDVVDGVQACGCGCGNASWAAVVLKQERGRKVEVDFMYCGEERPKKEEVNATRVLLVPGAAPSAKAIVRDAGLGYEANEEYWEAIRRRNGNLGALCRGLWRRAVGPVTVADGHDVVHDKEVASGVAFDVERA